MDAMIGVPFLSLAAVCMALAQIGRTDGRGLLWRIGTLAAALPPAMLVVVLALDPTGKAVQGVFMASLLASVWLSAPLAAVMVWRVALSR